MRLDRVVLGQLEENCYLLEKNHQYLLVDPGEDILKLIDFISDKHIIGILVTHHHHDHVGSLDYLVQHYHFPVYEYSNLKEGVMSIGPFSFEVIFTPGHCADMVCYYFKEDKVMITGDFLFKGSIGRCDLEGGSWNDMMMSIEKIKKYDDDIMIYPGHGDSTTLGKEKVSNLYF